VAVPHSSAVIIPVPDAEPLVGAMRRGYDQSAAFGAPAHLTLLYPFFAAPVADEVVDELAMMFATVQPLRMSFESVGRFPATLFLKPAPREPIVRLVEELVRRWPERPPYGGMFDEIVPHLTVANEQAEPRILERLERMLAPGLPLVTTLAEAWLIESDEGGFWHRRAWFRFGSGVTERVRSTP
jgi:2'-5' RNA ligase